MTTRVQDPNGTAKAVARGLREEFRLGSHAVTAFECYVSGDGTGIPRFKVQLANLTEAEARAMLEALRKVQAGS